MSILIPLSLIPLLLVFFIMSGTFQSLIVNRTLSNASDNSQLIINQIESIFDSAQDCGNLLTINLNRIYEDFESHGTPASQLAITNAISYELSFSLLTFTNIDSIAFYDANGNLYTSNHRLKDDYMEFYMSPLFRELEETTGPNHWFPVMKRNFAVKDPQTAYLTMGKKIININDGSTYGYLLINISESSINRMLFLQDYPYWIINSENQVISTNGEDILLQKINSSVFDDTLLRNNNYIGVRTVNDNKYVTTMIPFSKADWRLIGQLPYNELTRDLQQLFFSMFIVVIIVIVFGIIISWYFTRLLTDPIRQLNEGMYKVSQGDFNQRLNAITNDEIGEMAESFNHMSQQIMQLLTTIENEQLKKREYEMALIQEQIKPHFLYNCLDVIYTLNLMGRQKDAATATKSLADYYRVSLSKGADIITLEDEFNNVKDYLRLQKIRYSDVFDYTIDLPPELAKYKIIKLTLQPLVENAIYHGLKMQDELGHLSIKASQDKDTIKIVVNDNGIGMNEDVVQTILEPKETRKHYGLYNVLHRIQLFFGQNYDLSIDTSLGNGTCVTVTIPAILSVSKATALESDDSTKIKGDN